MTGPIPPKALTILLSCGAVLPFAAFFAAYPFEGAKRKLFNIASFIVGLIVISIVYIVLNHYI
jgi:hypothetical protein